MRKKSKGVAVVWIVILVSIFVFVILYNLFSQVYVADVFPTTEEIIQNADINETYKQKVLETTSNVKQVWLYLPWVFIVGLIIYGLVASQRKEPIYEPAY